MLTSIRIGETHQAMTGILKLLLLLRKVKGDNNLHLLNLNDDHMLPEELGQCQYEDGSDGKILILQ